MGGVELRRAAHAIRVAILFATREPDWCVELCRIAHAVCIALDAAWLDAARYPPQASSQHPTPLPPADLVVAGVGHKQRAPIRANGDAGAAFTGCHGAHAPGRRDVQHRVLSRDG